MIGQFELTVGPYRSGELRVVSFTGREAISSLFEFEVVFLSDIEWSELHPSIFSKRATLTVHGPEGITRYVHGIVSDLQGRGGRAATGKREYRARIMPRVGLLAQRVSSRIFQDKTVRQIVETVLGHANIPFRWAALPSYPVREYCLQYEESDLAFVERILAQHGIYYYFEHPTSAPDTEAEAAWSPYVKKVEDKILDTAVGLVTAAVGELGGSLADGLRRELEATGDVMVFGDTPHAYRTMPVKTATELGFALEFAQFEAMSEAERVLAAKASSLGGLTGKAAGYAVGALGSVTAVPLSPTPSLRLLPEGEYQSSEVIHSFSVSRRLRPNSLEISDFAYANPLHRRSAKATVDTSSAPSGFAGAVEGFALGKLEDAASRAGSTLTKATGLDLGLPNPFANVHGGDPPIPVYFHRAQFQESDATKPFAGVLLDQLRVDSTTAEGAGTCRRMAAGYRFVLVEEDVSAGLSGDYVVTSVEHVGSIPEFAEDEGLPLEGNYSNRFFCIPTGVVARPRIPPSPPQQVLETALVVGGSQAEGSLCVDTLGRIKVQFHWDREGKHDHHSSCWIRPSQPWAGRSWGFQFIPRVGMEVLVGFLGGDVDRPVVLGSAYNATHPVPFGLPESATVSGIRTRSCLPNEGDDEDPSGHNQLSFDDALGSERVYVRAERNFEALTVHRHELHVGKREKRNESGEGYLLEHVATDRTRHVGRDERVTVDRNALRAVRGDATLRVTGTSFCEVEGSSIERIRRSRELRVDGDAGYHYGSALRLHAAMGREVEVAREDTLRVIGDRHAVVAGNDALSVGLDFALSASGHISIASGRSLRLSCGEASIVLSESGIVLEGPSVTMVAKGEARIEAPGVSVLLADSTLRVDAKEEALLRADSAVRVTSGSSQLEVSGDAGWITSDAAVVMAHGGEAGLVLSGDAIVHGTNVLLNPSKSSATSSNFSPATPEYLKTSWVDVVLLDEFNQPVSGARFMVQMSNGEEISGVLDGQGHSRLPVTPGPTRIRFPDYDFEAWQERK